MRLVTTPPGPARVQLTYPPVRRPGLLVLGHGAGGGVDTLDLRAARQAGLALGLAVALVEQPYRVAGRRAPAPATQLDAAWLAVCAVLSEEHPGPLVAGGRSSGARVACRTAAASGAVAVLCLAFPLQPPSGRGRSREPELLAPQVPRLVVQGARDPFGVPCAAPGVELHVLPGADHSFRVKGRVAEEVGSEIEAAVAAWLGRESGRAGRRCARRTP